MRYLPTASSGLWAEYDSAAEWCAKRGIRGKQGDRLPDGISVDCWREITYDVEAFERRVRDCAYALAMEAHSN